MKNDNYSNFEQGQFTIANFMTPEKGICFLLTSDHIFIYQKGILFFNLGQNKGKNAFNFNHDAQVKHPDTSSTTTTCTSKLTVFTGSQFIFINFPISIYVVFRFGTNTLFNFIQFYFDIFSLSWFWLC